MHVSLEWLNEYVDLNGLTPEALAEALTNAGLEVEGIQQSGGNFTNVVVGKVTAIDKHPNADKLRLATVSISSGSTGSGSQQVVCGAPNIRENILIAFAKEGAQVISRKDGSLFTLGKATIRGVESCGMVCSLDELGLQEIYSQEEDGIWVLDGVVSESDLGKDLKKALKLEADTILETAPTANRGDHMSMIGVAREVAALFDRDLKIPEVKQVHPAPKGGRFTVVLPDQAVCQYYGGVVMQGMKVGPSPDWMVRRLQAAGVRSINNVVDITNYVMLETGQPLHAFDMDKLGHGGEVSVRYARDKESFKTLDGVEHQLTPNAVVVTLNHKPVALAGVMGGQETEIDDNSTNLFLESAYFPPAPNRRSGKSVGYRTDASARFERGIDPEGGKRALSRAAELLKEYAEAQYVTVVESPPKPQPPQDVTLRFARIEKILGIPVEKDDVLKILKKLGFLFKPTKEVNAVLVSVPSFRKHDVTREIDLIEEVIRIHGYDKVPYTLPQKTASAGLSRRQHVIGKAHNNLSGSGLQEVVTNSLIGEALLKKTGFDSATDRNALVSVTNSHSKEHTLLRQSLIPTLLEIAKFNQSQGLEDIWIYELGRTYFKTAEAGPKQSGVSEKLFAAGLMVGNPRQGNWQAEGDTGFYTLKGVVERFLSDYELNASLLFETESSLSYLHPGKSAGVSIAVGSGTTKFGVFGELHPSFQESLKFRHPVYVFEIDLEALNSHLAQVAQNQPPIEISVYPSVKRDMAFSAPETLTHQEILKTLQGVNDPLVRQIELFDEYRGEQVGQGNRSLAYRVTLQSSDETLTDAVIDQSIGKLKDTLSKKLSVTFR